MANECQQDSGKNKSKYLKRTWRKKSTIGTSHQKEIYIFWPCTPTPGKWTNKIDVPGKSSGRRGRRCPKTNHISNMKSWIGCNSEQLFKLDQDRESCHEVIFNAARATNIKHDDAVTD